MKIYAKIKRDGIWGWFRVETVQRRELAQTLCECRICELARIQAYGCQEKREYCHIHYLDWKDNCPRCEEEE